MAQAGKPLTGVIVIVADDEAIVGRITGRRSCPECGKIYHVKYLAPKKSGICDQDGTELTQRADDKEAVVRKRLQAYYEQTEPVIEYYRSRKGCPVVEVDGDPAPDVVTMDMIRAVRGLSGRA